VPNTIAQKDSQMSTGSRIALLSMLLVFSTGGCRVIDARASTGTATTAAGNTIVVQNFYYALPGKADEVYRWRLHASEVRARLGLAVGRVLRRSPPLGDEAGDAELPDVVWECEYPNVKARAADLARLNASGKFDVVEAHMQTLIRQFRREVFTFSSSEVAGD
jgi:hypothetical protein